jgi:ankyrin repeat protein
MSMQGKNKRKEKKKERKDLMNKKYHTKNSEFPTVTVDSKRSDRHVDIIECTKRGMIDRVEYYIKCGVDVNEQDYYGNYAVTCAAERGDMCILRMLVDAGANLKVKNGGGLTPLGFAIVNEDQEMIDYINGRFKNEQNL